MQNTYVLFNVVTNLKNTPRCHCVYIHTTTGGMAHAPLKIFVPPLVYVLVLLIAEYILLIANIF